MGQRHSISWDEGARERLKRAVRDFGTQQQLSTASRVPIPTIQKILAGTGDPGISRILALANALGLSLDEILTGIGDESGDWESALPPVGRGQVRIPVYDGRVSAGDGTVVLDGDPIDYNIFSAVWLKTLGNPDGMHLVQVNGDSMEPELRADDFVMVDYSQREPRESVFVFNLDGFAMVKRLRLKGNGEGELASTNPAYEPIPVRLDDPNLIVGRVVWIGRRMG